MRRELFLACCVGLGLLAVVAAYRIFAKSELAAHPHQQPAGDGPPRFTSSHDESSAEIRRLNSELRRLRADHERLADGLADPLGGAEEPRRLAEDQRRARPTPQEERELVEMDIAAFEDRLESEVEDDAWYREMSWGIQDALASVDGIALDRLECGSTMCRAEFAHEPGSTDAFGRVMMLAGPFQGELYTLRTEDADGRERTLVFVAREGYPLGLAAPSGS